jgi:hypothetical protein
LQTCREFCFNKTTDHLSDKERNCLKNCTNKYLEQFDILRTHESSYFTQYPVTIFLFNKEQKNSMKKLIDLVSINEKI